MAEKNNFYRLKQEADIAAVISYLQIPVQKKGSSYFIQCPLPEHNDKHATNCYYKDGWNNVYCYVCGKAIHAIDLIMYIQKCSYGEAADALWELEGRPDWYHADWKNKKKPKKKRLEISKDEASLLGIHLPSFVSCPSYLSETKEDLEHGQQYDKRNIDGYLLCNVCRVTSGDFISEEEFIALVMSKCNERFTEIKETAAYFKCLIMALHQQGIKDELTELLYESCINQLQLCKEVYKRARNLKE